MSLIIYKNRVRMYLVERYYKLINTFDVVLFLARGLSLTLLEDP